MPSPDMSFVAAIADRVRTVILVYHRSPLDDLATRLSTNEEKLRHLVIDCRDRVDAEYLLEILPSLIREFRVDPQWLLTGEYNASTHRRAFALVKEHGRGAEAALRRYVRRHFWRSSAADRSFHPRPVGGPTLLRTRPRATVSAVCFSAQGIRWGVTVVTEARPAEARTPPLPGAGLLFTCDDGTIRFLPIPRDALPSVGELMIKSNHDLGALAQHASVLTP